MTQELPFGMYIFLSVVFYQRQYHGLDDGVIHPDVPPGRSQIVLSLQSSGENVCRFITATCPDTVGLTVSRIDIYVSNNRN